jgi:hypothetical protein
LAVFAASLSFAGLAVPAANAVAQDYGSTSGWGLVVDLDEASGLIVGVRRYHTRYGYRRVTWAQRFEARALASIRAGLGADVVLRRRISPGGVVLSGEAGAARRLRSYRFYGFGNDRPLIDPERALVALDELWTAVALETPVGAAGAFAIGPIFRHVRSNPHERGPLAREGRLGAEPFSQLGLTANLELTAVDDPLFPREGVALHARWSAFAPVLDATEWFGGSGLELRGYLPLPAAAALALRVGGGFTSGSAPVHEAVFLGGAESLRGHRRQRYAGDAALHGTGELRVPLLRLPLFGDSQLGALAFADAGRVFVDGDSPGGWHTAKGGGLWYLMPAATVTAVYAWGEQRSAHVYLGLPF